VSLKVDLKKDLFHIAYDPQRVTPDRMLEAVRSKGFRGQVVKAGPSATFAEQKVRRDLGRLPAEFERTVKEAKEANKLLLVTFHGLGCAPCKKMDAVTYSDAAVKEELSCWVLVRVDVSEHREVAELFDVSGIPVAVAVTTDGDEIGRIENFVEPAVFRKRLEELRPRSGE
jgi:thiol:disulfide interchange protein